MTDCRVKVCVESVGLTVVNQTQVVSGVLRHVRHRVIVNLRLLLDVLMLSVPKEG